MTEMTELMKKIMVDEEMSKTFIEIAIKGVEKRREELKKEAVKDDYVGEEQDVIEMMLNSCLAICGVLPHVKDRVFYSILSNAVTLFLGKGDRVFKLREYGNKLIREEAMEKLNRMIGGAER